MGQSWTSKASLTIGDGLSRLDGELRRLGARDIVISSNLHLRQDGLPYANQRTLLDDPGIAVYFALRGRPMTLACDRWRSAGENMAAIAGHIAAIRASDRYGVGTVEQAFAGYAALPPSASVDWWLVLGVSPDADLEIIEAAFKQKALAQHPDRGGTHDAMAALTTARAAARAARRGGSS